MKIESAKDFTASSGGASKTNLANSESQNSDGAGDEVQDGSDFASVLENLSSKNDSADQKTDSNKTSAEREKDSSTSKLDQPHKTEQPSKNKINNHDASHEEAAGAAAALRVNNANNLRVETALPVPPARAILHIADLERIVSSVRAQNFDGNSQVVITLKNSVCSGLQIKLTSDDNHRVTAELIAVNEKVKAQIDARSGELADLLRQRGVKLTSLQTSVGADTSGQNGNRQPSDNLETQSVSSQSASISESDTDGQILEVNETASNYRV